MQRFPIIKQKSLSLSYLIQITDNIMDLHIREDEEDSNSTNKWKTYVITVLFILAGFTVWAAYLIVNGSLSFMKVPLSKNILDDFSIVCILYFVGVFIALAHHYGILGFDKIALLTRKKEKQADETETTKEKKSTKHYVWPFFKTFVAIPVLCAVLLYYIIYFILFIFLGSMPYIVSIAMVLGLIVSLIKMSRMVYSSSRGRKIMVYSTLIILCYAFTIFLIYHLSDKSDVHMKQQVNQTSQY